jgi:hypothetical protein
LEIGRFSIVLFRRRSRWRVTGCAYNGQKDASGCDLPYNSGLVFEEEK